MIGSVEKDDNIGIDAETDIELSSETTESSRVCAIRKHSIASRNVDLIVISLWLSVFSTIRIEEDGNRDVLPHQLVSWPKNLK